jgi:hypothetical protein
LLLHKLTDYGLSAGYANWFHGYLTSRLSFVRCSVVTFPSIIWCPSRICVRSFDINIYTSDLLNVITFSSYLLFCGWQNVSAVKACLHCFLLRKDIDFVHGWRRANHMKINVSENSGISFAAELYALFWAKLCG